MKVFILIIVISSGYSDSGKITVQQEFKTLDQCEYVRTTLLNQMRGAGRTEVIANGCFEK